VTAYGVCVHTQVRFHLSQSIERELVKSWCVKGLSHGTWVLSARSAPFDPKGYEAEGTILSGFTHYPHHL